LLFTVVVAIRARDRLWKKSNLPLLFCGLPHHDRMALADSEDLEDMKAIAEGTKAQFQKTPAGQVRLTATSIT
jgi:hypothetical protein